MVAGILERGINIEGLGQRCFLTYESNVLFALRFMIDCDVVGGNWIELPAGSYKDSQTRKSYCQLDVDVLYPSPRCTIPCLYVGFHWL
jgi:DNA polymerase delta subunit 1